MTNLQMVVETLKIYQQTYPEDAVLFVIDHEKVVGGISGKNIQLQFPVGTPLEGLRGTVIEKAFRTGARIQEERPENQVVATAAPIYEGDIVVGAVVAVVSNKKYDTLRANASDLAAMVEEMNATTDAVTNATQDMSSRVVNTAEISEILSKDIEAIHSIATFVQQIASQSQLLGLNATIEAARAGEHGQGFSVVADYMRQMADQSKRSAKDIQEKLDRMRSFIQQINASMQQISTNAEEHLANMEELKATFDHIARTADNLSTFSELGT